MDLMQTIDIIEVMENYMEKKRPPEDFRSKLDLGYQIEGQSIIIYEIRLKWNEPGVIMKCPVAKTTFVKSKGYWKVFWMRSDLKWHSYSADPIVKKITDFVRIVDRDECGCFWG